MDDVWALSSTNKYFPHIEKMEDVWVAQISTFRTQNIFEDVWVEQISTYFPHTEKMEDVWAE